MNISAAGFDFSKFVPGFDFLKQMTQPRSLMPSPAQWVAPTVDPEEVDRRIQELRTVQFWLEQNTTALKATIQALEVQKLTLTTLKSMNVGLNDMAQVFQQGVADTVSSVTQAVKAAVPEAPADEPASATTWHEVPVQSAASTAAEPEEAPAAGQEGESPFNTAFAQAGQWWGSMMQTFQSIAQQAQEDVLQRQSEFLKAQEEMAQQVAAAMPDMQPAEAPAPASRPSASSKAAAKPAASKPAGAKPAAGKAAVKSAAPRAGASRAAAKPAAARATASKAATPKAKPAAAARKPAAAPTSGSKSAGKPRA